jgi:hypothetical protein
VGLVRNNVDDDNDDNNVIQDNRIKIFVNVRVMKLKDEGIEMKDVREGIRRNEDDEKGLFSG